jgi:hypothetical protein
MPIGCSVFGHRVLFESDAELMSWRCLRDCDFHGEKRYETSRQAATYATAFNRPEAEIGRRSLLSLAPLRLAKSKLLR